MKKWIKVTIFLTILFFIWNYVFQILWINNTPIKSYFQEPKDTIDIAYIGSSNAYVHFNSVLAFHNYGFTTGLISADSQPFAAIKYLIQESQKYQHPSLYVIDIARVVDNLDSFTDANIRVTLDSIKNGKNRVNAYNELLKYTNKGEIISLNEYINHYFSFFLYHSRWKEITKTSFMGNETLYKGHILFVSSVNKVPMDNFIWNNDTWIEIPEENKKVLINLLNYIKENQINALFVIPIRNFSKDLNSKLNYVTKIFQNEGYQVINFNKEPELNIDFQQDFYNQNHLNAYGATKYTMFFSNYLINHYSLPDHRKDNNYQSWEEEYARYTKDFQKLTGKNFQDLLK